MIRSLEYPLCVFFQQLHWAWKNWHLRPMEEDRWHEIVLHFGSEIRNYLETKAAKRRP